MASSTLITAPCSCKNGIYYLVVGTVYYIGPLACLIILFNSHILTDFGGRSSSIMYKTAIVPFLGGLLLLVKMST
jgi:hypothetical protein